MSSSCRSRIERRAGAATCIAVPVAAVLLASPAVAQQLYFVPAVEATVDYDSNRELVEDGDLADAAASYEVEAQALVGRRSPIGVVEFRPRVRFQEFPSREGIDPVEFFVDGRGDWRRQKSRFGFRARFASEDAFNAEYGDPNFDELDPTDDDAVASGITFVGGTRRTLKIEPVFRYDFTPLGGVGFRASFEKVDFERDFFPQRVGYESPRVELTGIRKLGPRLEVELGPFAARYEEDTGVQKTDTVGLVGRARIEYSQTTWFDVAVSGERNEGENTLLGTESRVTNWGAEFSGAHRQRVGRVRYALGRFVSPSTLGQRRALDQLRVQYERPLTPLLSLNGALRLTREDRPSREGEAERRRALAEVSLLRQLTPTLYVSGGVRYAWQEFTAATGTGSNYGAFVSFGYSGLNRAEQRRP